MSDSPEFSWSTGTDPAVTSHYQRVLAANSVIIGDEYNDARSGAKMVDLAGQVTTAAGEGVQYLTILMGANDMCTSSPATMTPTATFRTQFAQALAAFFARDRGAPVLVSSIPNIYQLWNTLQDNWAAEVTWNSFAICQSILSWSNSEADRQKVVTQEQADNAALASVCRRWVNCTWDRKAVYNVQFPASDVSTVDYFHPNKAGQNALANATWAAGYWPRTP